jgi:chromate transporter
VISREDAVNEAGERIEKPKYKSALITALVNGYQQLRSQLRGQLRARLRRRITEHFAPQETRVEWRALARTFLKLGATGFGGGIAVLAQIRRLVVRERRWLSDEESLDAVSLAQSLPGANAANAITYIGLKLGGIRGATVSVTSFILPSFLIMIGLTVAHDHLIQFADAQRVFQGFNAAVVGLIAAMTVRLGQTAMQQQWRLELGVAAGFMLIFTQTTVAEVVLLAGIIGVAVRSYKTRARRQVRQRLRKEHQASARSVAAEQQARQHAAEMIENPDSLADDYKLEVSLPEKGPSDNATDESDRKDSEKVGEEEKEPDDKPADEQRPFIPIAGKKGVTSKLRSFAPLPLVLLLAWPVLEQLVTIWQLVTIFLRVGTVTFGGGYVMVPQIETDVVEVHRWMNHQTFANGMAFGQITPGPVLITATFIGYKVVGVAGAVAATVAAFLPSFVMTVIAGASINRFRTNFHVQAFLAGVAPAVVGMLAAAGVTMAKSGLSDATGFGVATLACLLMLRAKLNPVVIIFGCGLLQWVISRGLIGWLPT